MTWESCRSAALKTCWQPGAGCIRRRRSTGPAWTAAPPTRGGEAEPSRWESGYRYSTQAGNYKLPQKLREKYAGPFEVVALPADDSPTNYIVKCIAGGGQALIVHVKRLRAYRHTPTTRLVAGSRTTRNRKSKRYEVARIIDTRMTTRGREYKVLWEPCADNEFDTTEQTWEFEEELKCAEKVRPFIRASKT